MKTFAGDHKHAAHISDRETLWAVDRMYAATEGFISFRFGSA
jgi:hypothetical protein